MRFLAMLIKILFVLYCVLNDVVYSYDCSCLGCKRRIEQKNIMIIDFALKPEQLVDTKDDPNSIFDFGEIRKKNSNLSKSKIEAFRISNMESCSYAVLKEIFNSNTTFIIFTDCIFNERELKELPFANLCNLETLTFQHCTLSLETICWILNQLAETDASKKLQHFILVDTSSDIAHSTIDMESDSQLFTKERVRLPFERFTNLLSLHIESISAKALDYDEIMTSIKDLNHFQSFSFTNNDIESLNFDGISFASFHSIFLDSNKFDIKSCMNLLKNLNGKSIGTLSFIKNNLPKLSEMNIQELEFKNMEFKIGNLHLELTQVNFFSTLQIEWEWMTIFVPEMLNEKYNSIIPALKRCYHSPNVMFDFHISALNNPSLVENFIEDPPMFKISDSESVPPKMRISFTGEEFMSCFQIERTEESLKSEQLTEDDFKRASNCLLTKLKSFSNEFNLSEISFLYEQMKLRDNGIYSFHLKFNYARHLKRSKEYHRYNSFYFEEIAKEKNSLKEYLPIILVRRMFPIFYCGMPHTIKYYGMDLTSKVLSIIKNAVVYLGLVYEQIHSCSILIGFFASSTSFQSEVTDTESMKRYFAPLLEEERSKEYIEGITKENLLQYLETNKFPSIMSIFMSNLKIIISYSVKRIARMKNESDYYSTYLALLSNDSDTFPIDIFTKNIEESRINPITMLKYTIIAVASSQYSVEIHVNDTIFESLHLIDKFEGIETKAFYFFAIYFSSCNAKESNDDTQSEESTESLTKFVLEHVIFTEGTVLEKFPEKETFQTFGSLLYSSYSKENETTLLSSDERWSFGRSRKALLAMKNSTFLKPRNKALLKWDGFRVEKRIKTNENFEQSKLFYIKKDDKK